MDEYEGHTSKTFRLALYAGLPDWAIFPAQSGNPVVWIVFAWPRISLATRGAAPARGVTN